MDTTESSIPPNPGMMPRRRPVVAALPPRSKNVFAVAAAVPRRGWPDAVVWPDTGILLAVGTNSDLPPRFRRHYRGRVRVSRNVDLEMRSHTDARPTADAKESDHQRFAAAELAFNELLFGAGKLNIVDLTEGDYATYDSIREKFKGLDPTKRHGGESATIALASRLKTSGDREHIFLTNDGMASIVAEKHGIPSRHVADMIIEFACADPTLSSETCFALVTEALPVTAPPRSSVPKVHTELKCFSNEGTCTECEEV